MNRQRASRVIAVALSVATIALAVSCHSGSNALQPSSRQAMLRDLALVVIVPTYQSLAAEAAGLAAVAAELEVTIQGESLTATQRAWRRTRAVWKQSEAFAIGPAATLRTAAKIDWAPARIDRIEDEIAGADELTAATVENLGANLKGFIALEYLLFDPDGGDAAVLAALNADLRRRAYVRALAENLRDQALLLRDAWAPDGGDFAGELGSAGRGSTTYPTVKSAVDALVNQMIFLSEDVADAQLLAALGARSGGTPQPDALDAHRSENGLADLLDNLAGIQNAYFGAYGGHQGGNLNAIVDAISPRVGSAIAQAIQQALAAAASIPDPLEEAVSSEQPLVERAQLRAKELMRRLEIDLITALGATLRFNPSDGD
jgi:predicted lipoprotein